jgi:Kef-type K+ transport system membrane component KefB
VIELPAIAFAAPDAGDIGVLLFALMSILTSTKLFGELAQRFGQPAVLGELIAGVVIGKSVLGIVDPANPVIHAMSEIGVIILLFAIGLETELASLVKVGAAAMTVAVTGVAVPFAFGYFAATAIGLEPLHALVCGAALTATSVGITARVLSDLGWLESQEGKVILGAAVIDDIIGLIILAVIATMVAGGAPSITNVGRIAGVAVLFVVLAVVAGGVVAKPVFATVARARSAGALGAMGLAFAFLLSWLARLSGSAMIVGAFAAGLVLYRIPQKHDIEKATTHLGHFFVPVFFASVGAAVDLGALADPQALLLGGVLIACGIIGKLVAGYAPWWFKGDKTLVGIGMVPRGEVGLIFAQMGLAAGAVTAGQYGAIMLMVLATTFVTPPALAWRARSLAGKSKPSPDRPGEGGIDDLVAGTTPRRK